eukprot:14783863-Ditylum_brightwellii.AAC.2
MDEEKIPVLIQHKDDDDNDKADSDDESDKDNNADDIPGLRSGKRHMNKDKMEDAINELYDELDAAKNNKGNTEIERILAHNFQKGTFILKVQYYSKTLAEMDVAEVSYRILKNDEPVALARYIKEHVVEESGRNGFYNIWASKILKQNAHVIWRLHCIKETERNFMIKIIQMTGRQRELVRRQEINGYPELQGIKKKMSRNARNQKQCVKGKFEIKIPKNTWEALLIDQINGDNKWDEAITKEMNALERLNNFEYHNPGTYFLEKKCGNVPQRRWYLT